jgi:hypothetical protein
MGSTGNGLRTRASTASVTATTVCVVDDTGRATGTSFTTSNTTVVAREGQHNGSDAA